jgi:hypothetical protein
VWEVVGLYSMKLRTTVPVDGLKLSSRLDEDKSHPVEGLIRGVNTWIMLRPLPINRSSGLIQILANIYRYPAGIYRTDSTVFGVWMRPVKSSNENGESRKKRRKRKTNVRELPSCRLSKKYHKGTWR